MILQSLNLSEPKDLFARNVFYDNKELPLERFGVFKENMNIALENVFFNLKQRELIPSHLQ